MTNEEAIAALRGVLMQAMLALDDAACQEVQYSGEWQVLQDLILTAARVLRKTEGFSE